MKKSHVQKFAMIFALLGMNSLASAGAMRITCIGNNAQLETAAKGGRPYEDQIFMRMSDNEKITDTKMKAVFGFDARANYDFHFIYQSMEPEKNILAMIQFKNNVHSFSASVNGKMIEKNVPCTFGFY